MSLLPRNKPPKPLVLFVDDSEVALDLVQYLFRDSPIDIETRASALAALDYLAQHQVALVVADYDLGPGMHGLDLLDTVIECYPMTGRILYSSTLDSEIVSQSQHKVLSKGMDPALVKRAVLREALRHAP
jgi:CheY-like chemotaxis protein